MLKAALLAAALAAAPAAPALAHHSFAMFDNDHQVKLQGTVTHFQWTNPHVYVELETMEGDGTTKRWTIECANPGILDRVGWKFNMIKVGDKLKMVVAPLRTGEAGGLLKEVVLPDGRTFNNGPAAGPAAIHF
jgi:hypothetical protein